MTIVEFLTARLDEMERVARDADEYSRRVNGPDRPDAGMHLNMDLPALIVDERRVLREVEAKRALLGLWEQRSDDEASTPTRRAMVAGIGIALEALASVYADHPDYRQEWAP